MLRDVRASDLPLFFVFQQDREANRMAAFTAKDPDDREAFEAYWARNLANETTTTKTIVWEGQVVGHIASFVQDGEREMTYWIGRDYWGRGIATQALAEFLRLFPERPLSARAAKDNVASRRVLEKCGFQVIGEDRGFAQARGEETEEYLLRLDPS